jgi:uncharacterized protein (TIGR00369 family)
MTSYDYGLANPQEAAGKSGKELLQAVIDGRLPQAPISKTLLFWLVEVGDGFAAFEGDLGSQLLNPMGTVHGGWALTLIDSAAACAGHSLLPAGAGYTTIETKGNFSRPITTDAGRERLGGPGPAYAPLSHSGDQGRELPPAGRQTPPTPHGLIPPATSFTLQPRHLIPDVRRPSLNQRHQIRPPRAAILNRPQQLIQRPSLKQPEMTLSSTWKCFRDGFRVALCAIRQVRASRCRPLILLAFTYRLVGLTRENEDENDNRDNGPDRRWLHGYRQSGRPQTA